VPGGSATTAASPEQRRARARIEGRFRQALSRLPLSPGSGLLVAVSGGPDSSALLLLLERFTSRLRVRLEAAYFNHQLQPSSEQALERRSVYALCEGLHIPLHEGSGDVRSVSRVNKSSLEAEARAQRYCFLARTANATRAVAVMVGHTLDDQAETILLHILRGSGLRGLAGMRAQTPWPFGPGPWLLRPLLDLRRSDTAAYCGLRGWQPHRDMSNESAAYTRNRLRHELLPLLRSFNPRVEPALARLGEAAAQAIDVDELPGDPGVPSGVLSVSDLLTRDPNERSRMIAGAYTRTRGGVSELTAQHYTALLSLVDAGHDQRVDLPGGISAQTESGWLRFGRTRMGCLPEQAPRLPETPLEVPGVTRYGNWLLAADTVPPGAEFRPTALTASLAVSEPPERLSVRTWQSGDRIRPSGLGGHKKLQDIFVDAGVPRAERSLVPVVCAGGSVVWVVGLRHDERAVAGGLTPTVRLSASRTSN
jgi:tRNA(Ile)-lysidine synthase